MSRGRLYLRPERAKPVIQRHPWIFSRAIARIEGDPAPGSLVDIYTHDGRRLAAGYWNPRSQIQARILTWDDEPIDDGWWKRRLSRAIDARQALGAEYQTNACRLIHAESDYLPGLIVDQYNEWLVLQALTLGIDQRKHELARFLLELTGARGVFERSDVDVRRKEGLPPHRGPLAGDVPPEHVPIAEAGIALAVPIATGHKTGFYLDQRPNRMLTGALIRRLGAGAHLLNLFSYTGGFGLQALAAGAERVVQVDSSADALALAAQQIELNAFDAARVEHVQADVFDYIRELNARGSQFDVVVCDPPKFAQSEQQVERAARGYKDLNLHSFRLVKPGGYLLTFSCSGAISRDLFQKIVFGALADSGRDGQILMHLGAGEDHPIALTFPEGEYLKGLLIRVY
ncbi:MAG: class I SAM-dependent rRNA methyltransferase [Candidatus Flexifilum sp.]|jgi:23S rRNA (cytosine1962-C5)-methyltransferase